MGIIFRMNSICSRIGDQDTRFKEKSSRLKAQGAWKKYEENNLGVVKLRKEVGQPSGAAFLWSAQRPTLRSDRNGEVG